MKRLSFLFSLSPSPPPLLPGEGFSGFPVHSCLKWCHSGVFPLGSDELIEGDSYRAGLGW